MDFGAGMIVRSIDPSKIIYKSLWKYPVLGWKSFRPITLSNLAAHFVIKILKNLYFPANYWKRVQLKKNDPLHRQLPSWPCQPHGLDLSLSENLVLLGSWLVTFCRRDIARKFMFCFRNARHIITLGLTVLIILKCDRLSYLA